LVTDMHVDRIGLSIGHVGAFSGCAEPSCALCAMVHNP
jgi:hypothetical protein